MLQEEQNALEILFQSPCFLASEMSQQLPANVVGIMEQRMKLIEQRSAYLLEQINQVISDGQSFSLMVSVMNKNDMVYHCVRIKIALLQYP
jgi:hypothetical protein